MYVTLHVDMCHTHVLVIAALPSLPEALDHVQMWQLSLSPAQFDCLSKSVPNRSANKSLCSHTIYNHEIAMQHKVPVVRTESTGLRTCLHSTVRSD